PLHLGQAEPQQLRLLGALPGPFDQTAQLALQLPERAPVGAVAVEVCGQRLAGVSVQRLALPGGGAQPDRLALAVHGDEVLGELPEQPDRDRAAAEVTTAAAL